MQDIELLITDINHSINHIKNQVNSNFYGPYKQTSVQNLLKNINELSFEVRTKNAVLYNDLQWIRAMLFYGANFINLFALGMMSQLLNLNIFQTDSSSFWAYMHPRLIELCKKKFEDGHYADAVKTAFIEIADIVRKFRIDNGYDDIVSDSGMMRNTFNKDSPILKFNELKTTTEKHIQEGYEQIFAGAMQAIRNPVSHSNPTISEADSARKLILASDLMYKIDEAFEYMKTIV